MRPIRALSAYAVVLAVVFAAALGAGRLVGPVGTSGDPTHAGPSHATSQAPHGPGHASGDQPTTVGQEREPRPLPGGLAIAQDGYALQLEPYADQVLRFRVTAPDGAPQQQFATVLDKELHLIVVRRDLTGYQHVHPVRDRTGTWSVPLRIDRPGPYKVFADFTPRGRDRAIILGADLQVPGQFAPLALPPVRTSAAVGPYRVSVTGELDAGRTSELGFRIQRDGRDVTDLDRYLGAHGHLVVLRPGDLAYLHVHPEEGKAGPEVRFETEVPSHGAYRVFLDFQHQGAVRTAELTVVAR